jgi:coenzyme F420-reducing hydrogenase alpha subunit
MTDTGEPTSDDFVQSFARGLAVIRAFDPCLACSTHAAGQMPMEITLLSPEGKSLDRLVR